MQNWIIIYHFRYIYFFKYITSPFKFDKFSFYLCHKGGVMHHWVLAEVGSSLDSLVLQLLFIVKDGLCLNPDPSRLNEHDASVS